MRAGLRETTFIRLRQLHEELMAQRELQNGVAEEFEALVVDTAALRLVAHATVRQCLSEQTRLAK